MRALRAVVVGLVVWFVVALVYGFVVASTSPGATGVGVQLAGLLPALVGGACAAALQRRPERGSAWGVWAIASTAGPVLGSLATVLFVASTVTEDSPVLSMVVGSLVAAAIGAGLVYGLQTYRRRRSPTY